MIERFKEMDVPRPANWGGYRLIPTRVEFWKGRQGRMHDRIVYSISNSNENEIKGENGDKSTTSNKERKKWDVVRLQP